MNYSTSFKSISFKLYVVEGWVLKNWCFWTVLLEKTLESPLDCKEIKPVNPKGYQPWIFTGKTDADAKAPALWLPDANSNSLEKTLCWERWRVGEGDGRGWDGWMASLIQWTLSKLQEIVKDREALRAVVHGVAELDMTEWLNNIYY